MCRAVGSGIALDNVAYSATCRYLAISTPVAHSKRMDHAQNVCYTAEAYGPCKKHKRTVPDILRWFEPGACGRTRSMRARPKSYRSRRKHGHGKRASSCERRTHESEAVHGKAGNMHMA
eukprot:scaffold123499_cov20-Tisochrysis_lutea.AAC.1